MNRHSNITKSILFLFTAVVCLCLLSLTLSIRDRNVEAHATEPEQTYDIRSSEAFKAYARAYAQGDRNPKDVLNISITSGSNISGNANNEDGFISIGTAARPFAGTLVISTAGVDTFHLAECPLFDYVSTDLTITGNGIVKIEREKSSESPAVGVLTSGALFANHVVAGTNAANWNILLSNYSGENPAATSFPGVIGDIADNATVNVTFTNTSSLAVSGSGNMGLICGTVGAGATLAVNTPVGSGTRTVSTASGNAGGLVGEMRSGSTLKFNSANNTGITAVSTSSGYAGGIAGYASGLTVEYADGVTDYAVSCSVSGTVGAGGLYGRYINTASAFGLQKYTIASGLTVSSNGNTGGVFGYLENTAESFTFNGNASGSEVFSVVLSNGTARGGVCGRLNSSALTNTLVFTDTDVTVNSTYAADKYSGGIIGVISDEPAYVSFSAITSRSSSSVLYGGLVGSAGAGGSFIDVSGLIAINGNFDAGLVNKLDEGVLRIQGTTDLSAFSQRDSASGTIVKSRGRALVYAKGDGKGTNGNWTLKRNLYNAIDDIHAWGQVIRADGVHLTEGDLFTVDMTAHTVTVKGAVTTMSTVTQFALTALNIKLNSGTGVGSLLFTSGSANRSSTLLSGTLTLGDDIDLADTGLLGLTRDNGTNNAFSGTFNGANHTITFASGEPYGLNGSGAALEADSKQGNIYTHSHSGLFAKTNNATFNNLTLSGNFTINQSSDGMKLGGVVAEASGTLTLNPVTVNYTVSFKTTGDNTFWFGGAIGQATGNSLSVAVTNCSIQPTFTDATANSVSGRTNTTYVGGVIGGVETGSATSPTQAVAFSGTSIDLTYTKSINTARESAFGGAIAHIGNATYVKARRTVSFTGTSVEVTATGRTGGRRFGGILGIDWLAVDVAVTSLTTTSSITAAGSVADYGGLVQTATGGWSVTGLTVSSASYTIPNNSSTFGFVANKTSSGSNALYLSVDNTGSNYNIGALSFTSDPAFSVFDEVVADSRYQTADLSSNGNSVISITTSDDVITTSGSAFNTYLNKTAYGRTAAGETNGQTRYYYNLDYARNHTATAKYDFLVWSVCQYAKENLAGWFDYTSSTFTGSLDMTGLSYYPIDLYSSSVTFSGATLKLDGTTMEDSVKYAYYYDDSGIHSSASRSTLTSGNQHYLMHTSVFRNVTSSITVSGASGLTMQGNVPKLSNSSCGFLISGTLGESVDQNAKFTATKLAFDNVYITSSGSQLSTTAYAPLCINKIGINTALTINGGTQSGYPNPHAYYAASSLIGDVGSSSARAIYLTFTGLAFDGRSTATSIGNMDTTYGTKRSIFSRATILNSFIYLNECSGMYTFSLTDDWTDSSTAVHKVTYGKEITSSAEFAGMEKKYSTQTTYYVRPDPYPTTSDEYDFSTGFLPYVYVAYNDPTTDYKHELRINISISTTIEGCGKYDDPFIIDDEEKLRSIANIISSNTGSGVSLYLPENLASDSSWTSTGYDKYLYDFGSPYTSSGHTSIDADVVRRYLTGAYYVITRDITLADSYVGLGATSSADYAFRGVVIGRGNPTVTNTSTEPFIKTSLGCVVQNVTIDVNTASAISLTTPTGEAVYNYSGGLSYYGAVIGQILGGDTIIDKVQATFTSISFSYTSPSSNYNRLLAIGGYVGALVNGGLIFRNMTASNVGLTSSVFDKVANSGYLYVNPIIGRVVAGYAFHETDTYRATEDTVTLKNGTKNYTITDFDISGGALTVSYSGGAFTIQVPDGQALFVLGAIINSGAASATYNSSTENTYDSASALTAFWSAYRAYTTARAGSDYSTVGTTSGAAYTAAQDDAYTDNSIKIPYVIRAYSNKTGSVYLARAIASDDDCILKFTGNCEVSAGFRGIGSIYFNNDLVRLRIQKCTGQIGETETSYTLNFHMRYIEYDHVNVSVYRALTSKEATGSGDSNPTTSGFGLFNVLKLKSASDSNSVQYLTLSGNIFYDVYTLSGTQSLYNFASLGGNNDRDTKGTPSSDATTVHRTSYLSVGGVAGLIPSAVYIKNVLFDGLTVEGAKTAGGLIGYAVGFGESTIAYTVSASESGCVSATAGLHAGGLVGRLFNAGVKISGASGKTYIKIGTVETKATTPNETGMLYYANITTGAGGLVGSSWSGDGSSEGSTTGTSMKNLYLSPGVKLNAGLSSINTCVRNIHVDKIILTKGDSAAYVRVRNNNATTAQNNYAGGFIGATHNVYVKITDCQVKGVNVSANVAGGLIGKITQKYCLYISGVEVDGNNKTCTISGTRYAGGAVGWAIGRDVIYFQLFNFIAKDYIIQSTTTNAIEAGAGGIVGYAQGDNVAVNVANNVVCEYNNLTVLNCDIKANYAYSGTYNYKCGVGGLIAVIDTDYNGTGSRTLNNKFKFSGYNILVKDCTFTYKEGGSTEKNTAATNQRIGDIVGNNSVSTTLKLVGVSVQNATYCGKHVGCYGSDTDNYGSDGTFGTGYLVLANYGGVTTNTTFSTIADGDNDADNYTNVDVAYPYVTANPSMTIGGVMITGDGIAASTSALKIENIKTDGASGRYGYAVSAYYSGDSGPTNLAVYNSFGAKIVMFSSEVSGYLDTDFPVLIVDDTTQANSHKLVNSYLRLLTNTTHDFGTDSSGVYSVFIYNMVYDNGTFTPSATGASLRRNDGYFYMSNNMFDSGKTQFSLIDVRFFDPATPAKTAYHLYVPVFVKKVLSYSFDIAVRSGTTYHSSTYSSNYGEALVENTGSPVTFYFSYTYQRTALEWQTAINTGESVHRNYAKNLLFYKANTNDVLKNFPADTVLVLVDPSKGGRPYYSTIGDALVGNTLSLSAFRTGFSKSGGIITLSGDYFSPTNLEDLFTLTATTGNEGDNMVQCADEYATVFVPVGNGTYQGYRVAEDSELANGAITKYTIGVTIPNSATNLSERYYLSVFTENASLFHYYLVTTPSAFSETAFPSRIEDNGPDTMVHLIMGSIFSHSDFEITSSSELDTDVMTSDNNQLIIDMTAQFGLSDSLSGDIKTNMQDIIEDIDVYQSFIVYLNRKEGNSITKVIIGDPTGTGSYNIDYVLNQTSDTAMTAYTSGAIHVTQNYAEFVSPDLSAVFSTGNKFEINATITLTYPASAITVQFPGRGSSSPDSGVTVSGSSHLAFSESSTAYSKNIVSADESPATSYYSEADPEIAILDLNPFGDTRGDFTQLGINALNNDGSPTAKFDLLAAINVTAVSDQIAQYYDAVLTVTLEQKQANGTYGSALDISQYLTLTLEGLDGEGGHRPDPIVDNDTSFTAILDREHDLVDGAEIVLPIMHFTVLTGSALESAGLSYGNYRIDVNIVLRNSSGDEYPVSRVSNYVVYTNAKILPDYIE